MVPSLLFAAPASLTYQGRILKADSTPLEYNSVSFLFQITDPSGACVLYQEQVDGYNMSNSGGVFDTAIGKGSRSFPSSGAFTILDSLNNTNLLSCLGGSTYTPVIDDGRILRVQFYDGFGWKLITPDNVIRSVPYAGYAASAAKIGNNVPGDFVIKTGIPTCSLGTFLSWDGTALSCLAVTGLGGGTVTNVMSTNSYLSVATSSTTPTLTVNVGTSAGTVAAGDDARFVDARTPIGTAGGDLSGSFPNPLIAKLQGTAISAVVPTTGNFLKYNGTNWQGTAIAISDVIGLSASLSGAMLQSQFPASCAASQTLTFVSPSGSFTCSAIAINGAQVTGNIAGNAAGFTGSLSGDISGTQGATSVDKIKGTPVVNTGLATGKVLQYDGTQWIPTTPAAGNPGTVTNVTVTAPLVVATGTTTPALSIVQATTAISGYLSSADWNNFNGKQAPATTLSGYGITDAIKNAGGAVSIQAGLDAGKSALTLAGQIYFATDTQKIYRHNGASLDIIASVDAVGGGGTVTSVAAANADIGVATGTTTPVLTLNSGVGPNQILKLDGTSKIPAVDGSLIINLNPANLSAVVPVNKGGTGQSTYTDGQLLIGNSTGNTLAKASLTAGSGITITPGAGSITIAASGLGSTTLADGKIWVGQTTTPTAVTPAGDVTMTNAGSFSVAGVKGKSVSATPTTAGQVLRYDGVNWTPNFVAMTDLRSTVTGVNAFASSCATNQTLSYNSVGDVMSCSNISLPLSQTTGTLPVANGGTGQSTAAAAINALLPTQASNAGKILQTDGTNISWATSSANQWTATGSDIYFSGGKVGIGTTAPASPLDVVGTISATGDIAATGAGTGSLQLTAGGAPAAPAAGVANVFVNSTSGMIQCQYGAGATDCIPTYNNASNQLAGNVTTTTANTYYDGPSFLLATGTWMIQGTVTVQTASTTSAVGVTCKLWDGTIVISSAEQSSGVVTAAAARVLSVAVQGIVTAAGATTYKISCTQTIAGGTIRAATPDNGAGNNASSIWAFRLK